MNPSRARLLLGLLIIVVIAWIGYSRRIVLSAWLWHLRHGASLSIGYYTVPVPKNWYVQNSGSGPLLVRLDTDDRSQTKQIKAHAGISLANAAALSGEENIDLAISLDTGMLKKQGVDHVLRQTFGEGDTKIVCVGGLKPASRIGVYDDEPIAWSCASYKLQITILAAESDMQQVWNVVSGIKRRY